MPGQLIIKSVNMWQCLNIKELNTCQDALVLKIEHMAEIISIKQLNTVWGEEVTGEELRLTSTFWLASVGIGRSRSRQITRCWSSYRVLWAFLLRVIKKNGQIDKAPVFRGYPPEVSTGIFEA